MNQFILMNTQRGKTALTKQTIRTITEQDPYFIPFFVLDNNTALAVQFQQAVSDLGKTLALHSLGNTTTDAIKEYIELYVNHHYFKNIYDLNLPFDVLQHIVSFITPINNTLNQSNNITGNRRFPTPCIMGLCNKYQIPRLAYLMHYAASFGFKPLLIVDEADRTYPHCRNKLYPLAEQTIFVSATIGRLNRYEECVAASIVSAPLSEQYCGIITNETAQTQIYDIDGYKELSALQCLRDKRDYFFGRVVGQDGVVRHRKVLIHGSFILRMTELTRTLASEGWSVICVIGPGTYAAKDGRILGGVKNRKISVSQSIAALCAKYRLCEDRPLAVIGNRKMDRGITYHSWDGGIIFTDCLLGHINATDSAVQKAGRLAGNVARRPEFIGVATWWSNAKTLERIIKQNTTVMMVEPEQPLSTIFNKNIKIYGPFKHKHLLQAHRHLIKQQGKSFIKFGAPYLREAYNSTIDMCLILLDTYTLFAAKINNTYFICSRELISH